MKNCRTVLILVMLTAVLFASFLPAAAIDFTAEEKYESVFVIRSGNSLGSGFAIGSNCIITNAHVVGNKNQISVSAYNGQVCEARILGMDEKRDIAVLVTDAEFPVLKVADVSKIQTGADVYAIGAPKSMAYTLTKGVISAREREIGGYVYIQTDAPINEGNSGGPLLSATGEVLGMNTLKMTNSEGIGLAIPMANVCQYLQELGVALDEGGNVSGTVSVPTEHAHEHAHEHNATEGPVAGTRGRSFTVTVVLILVMVLVVVGVLVILGATLLVILVLNRKKRKQLPIVPPVIPVQNTEDPRERTDFEIEILE